MHEFHYPPIFAKQLIFFTSRPLRIAHYAITLLVLAFFTITLSGSGFPMVQWLPLVAAVVTLLVIWSMVVFLRMRLWERVPTDIILDGDTVILQRADREYYRFPRHHIYSIAREKQSSIMLAGVSRSNFLKVSLLDYPAGYFYVFPDINGYQQFAATFGQEIPQHEHPQVDSFRMKAWAYWLPVIMALATLAGTIAIAVIPPSPSQVPWNWHTWTPGAWIAMFWFFTGFIILCYFMFNLHPRAILFSRDTIEIVLLTKTVRLHPKDIYQLNFGQNFSGGFATVRYKGGRVFLNPQYFEDFDLLVNRFESFVANQP